MDEKKADIIFQKIIKNCEKICGQENIKPLSYDEFLCEMGQIESEELLLFNFQLNDLRQAELRMCFWQYCKQL
ncbi:MAG: hypothetical protein PHW34_01950 [Hespellia sp.]|nr:hypothetical protein [Hespellia sp.]